MPAPTAFAPPPVLARAGRESQFTADASALREAVVELARTNFGWLGCTGLLGEGVRVDLGEPELERRVSSDRVDRWLYWAARQVLSEVDAVGVVRAAHTTGALVTTGIAKLSSAGSNALAAVTRMRAGATTAAVTFADVERGAALTVTRAVVVGACVTVVTTVMLALA